MSLRNVTNSKEGEVMTKFEPGEAVAVPASVQPGAFPGEYLVTITTNSGPMSGFVRDRDFVEPQKTIHAIVSNSTLQTLVVRLAGSYFATNGLVEFTTDWARKNVKAIAA
jgi:hypothetical protein